MDPPPQKVWSELLYPREYPLAYHEMSILLPYLATRENRIDTYFTRVFNPVWTYPDGTAWIEARLGSGTISSGETQAGAERFRSGEGRHGEF